MCSKYANYFKLNSQHIWAGETYLTTKFESHTFTF